MPAKLFVSVQFTTKTEPTPNDLQLAASLFPARPCFLPVPVSSQMLVLLVTVEIEARLDGMNLWNLTAV